MVDFAFLPKPGSSPCFVVNKLQVCRRTQYWKSVTDSFRKGGFFGQQFGHFFSLKRCIFNCSYGQKLQEKNWKAMEALAAAEKTSSEKVSKAVTDQKVVIPQWVVVINLFVAWCILNDVKFQCKCALFLLFVFNIKFKASCCHLRVV